MIYLIVLRELATHRFSLIYEYDIQSSPSSNELRNNRLLLDKGTFIFCIRQNNI